MTIHPATEREEALYTALTIQLTEKGYAIIDGFTTPEETARLRQLALDHRQQGQFRAAGVGRQATYQHNHQVRGDIIQWVDEASLPGADQFFFHRINGLLRAVNRSCYLGLRRAEMHFAIYPPGTFYRRHLDVFHSQRSRRLSVICYLNEDWQATDGGQLRLYLPAPDGEQALDILPAGGRLVCFLSEEYEHEVLPATRERISLTGWMRDDDAL